VPDVARNRNGTHDLEGPSEITGKRGCGRPRSLHRQALRPRCLTSFITDTSFWPRIAFRITSRRNREKPQIPADRMRMTSGSLCRRLKITGGDFLNIRLYHLLLPVATLPFQACLARPRYVAAYASTILSVMKRDALRRPLAARSSLFCNTSRITFGAESKFSGSRY
jgi:hypothetical protein